MKNTLIVLLTILSFPAFSQTVIPNYFTASYNGYYKGEHVGFMSRHFKKENNDFKIESKSYIKGNYGFIPVTDNREEYSLFRIDNKNHFHPIYYEMNRTGTWIDFKMTADFDYKSNNIHMTYKDRTADKNINGNVLDNALFQLRLQHDIKNGKKSIKYDVAYKTGFRSYHYVYDSNEFVNLYGQSIELMKFKQIRKNKKGENKSSYFWVDPKRDYVMAQFVYYDKNGDETARFKLKDYIKK